MADGGDVGGALASLSDSLFDTLFELALDALALRFAGCRAAKAGSGMAAVVAATLDSL